MLAQSELTAIKNLKIFKGNKFLADFAADDICNKEKLKKLSEAVPSWSPSNPELLEIELLDKNGATKTKLRSGLRMIESIEERIYLNGRRFYVRGCIRGIKAHEHDNLLKLNESDFYRKYITAAKELGFNLVRWHSTIPSEIFLDLSDELGILNQIEFAPQYSFKNGKKEFTLDLKLIEETVKKLGWHPSVFAFCLGNEIHNSGEIDIVKQAVKIIRENSPCSLLLDSCGWGEADRTTADYLSQHIAYFFPFGNHLEMFNTRECFDLNGSIKKVEMGGEENLREAVLKYRRNLHPAKPTLAHETLHYISLPDIKSLRRKMKKAACQEPWWMAVIEQIAKEKGLWENWENYRKASEHFKKICLKEALERLRLSPWLEGYQMLQLADANYYENHNGIIDCFDDVKEVFKPVFTALNGDFAILADFRKKSFNSGIPFDINVYSANYSDADYLDFRMKVSAENNKRVIVKKDFKTVFVAKQGLNEIMNFQLTIKDKRPSRYILSIEAYRQNKIFASNSWDFWVFPEVKQEKTIDFLSSSPKVINKIDNGIIERLKKGYSYLYVFNPSVKLEKSGLPLVKDRFKPVIWDRGHQMGGIVRKHHISDKFPNSGLLDFQFYNLVEAGAKITADKLPGLTPVIEGIDKAARDRMDSLIFGKGEFQPQYTLRKFAYLFEMKVGRGKILFCTFNLAEENIRKNPEVAYFAEKLIEYFNSKAFKPGFALSADEFRKWSSESKKDVNIEPVMNVYWEEDLFPVETTLWWEKAGVDITKLKH